MKKRIGAVALAVIMSVCLSACSEVENEAKSDKSMFVCLETTMDWGIVYHKETKVMYAVSSASYNRGIFTLLVNPDGTPMLYESEGGE